MVHLSEGSFVQRFMGKTSSNHTPDPIRPTRQGPHPLGIDPGGWGMHPPLKNCGGITYAIQVGLPLAKNTKFIVTTWVLSSSECTRTSFRPAGAPPWTPLGKLTTLSQTPSRLPSPLLLKEIYANASPQPTHKVRNICTACIACIDCGFRHSRTL